MSAENRASSPPDTFVVGTAATATHYESKCEDEDEGGRRSRGEGGRGGSNDHIRAERRFFSKSGADDDSTQ